MILSCTPSSGSARKASGGGISTEKKQKLWLVTIAVIIVGFFVFTSTSGKTVPSISGNWDIAKEVNDQGYEKYLALTSDFDYNSENVLSKATQIKQGTTTPAEAIKETARFVYQTVRYSSQVTVGACYDETASSVLRDKTGDCVSMSRLVTALLRAQGIPARTMGGCLTSIRGCTPVFSVYPDTTIPTTPMSAGDFKKRGFLHEYVEVWTPENGWVLVEATAGQIFPLTCKTYLNYGYDSNKYDRCVITDQDFWNQCSAS